MIHTRSIEQIHWFRACLGACRPSTRRSPRNRLSELAYTSCAGYSRRPGWRSGLGDPRRRSRSPLGVKIRDRGVAYHGLAAKVVNRRPARRIWPWWRDEVGHGHSSELGSEDRWVRRTQFGRPVGQGHATESSDFTWWNHGATIPLPSPSNGPYARKQKAPALNNFATWWFTYIYD
jgi:hypothetical protein